jgi:hypothetical protein
LTTFFFLNFISDSLCQEAIKAKLSKSPKSTNNLITNTQTARLHETMAEPPSNGTVNFEALAHHATYGQPSAPSPHRVVPEWELTPFTLEHRSNLHATL